MFDWLRNCYSTFMRVSEDPTAPPVRVTWRFAAPGAKSFYGPTPFRSHVWTRKVWAEPFQGLGEVDRSLLKKDDPLTAVEPGLAVGSPVAWFRSGVPSGYNPKECCGKPLRKIVMEEETPGILAYYTDLDETYVAIIRERDLPDITLVGRTSDLAEVETPDVLDLDHASRLSEWETPDVTAWYAEPDLVEVETPDCPSYAELYAPIEVETPDVQDASPHLRVGVRLTSWTGYNAVPTCYLRVGVRMETWTGTNEEPTCYLRVGVRMETWTGNSDSPTAELRVGERLES